MGQQFRIEAFDKGGHRVARVIESDSETDARQLMRSRGYSIIRVRRLNPWRRWAWLPALALVLAILAVGFWLAPAATTVAAIVVLFLGGYRYDQWRRERAKQQRLDHKKAQRRAHREHLHHLELARAKELQDLERAVERVVRHFETRCEDLEDTLLEWDACQNTVDSVPLAVSQNLRDSIARKRQELLALEAELVRVATNNSPAAGSDGIWHMTGGPPTVMSRLTRCTTCSRTISNRAQRCVHCGELFRKPLGNNS